MASRATAERLCRRLCLGGTSCRCLQQLGDVGRNPFLQLTGLAVEDFQLLVEFSQPLGEVEVVVSLFCYADVPTRVEAPTLCLDLFQGGDLAQSGNVVVLQLGEGGLQVRV